MPSLTNSRLIASIQRRSEDNFYSDTALLVVDVATGAVDEFNNPVITTTETAINCSYNELSAKEQWRSYGDLGVVEAEIRFLSPTPTKGNHVKITSRYGGEPITSKTFEIISIDNRAAMGFLCALKAVEL